MASITTRNGRFLVRVRREGYRPVTKTFTRRHDGVAWGRMVEAAMESGRWRDATEVIPSLAVAIKTYRVEVAARLKGNATYAYWFDEVASSSLGSKPVDQIAPRDLAVWRDQQLAAGLRPGTVVRKLGLLSGVLGWAHKDRGWLTSNPARSISRLKFNDRRDRIVEAGEYAYLLAAARSGRVEWMADAIEVLAFSAMRRGELWSLQTSDIHFDRSIAQLHITKNGCAREVPLCPTSLAACKRLCVAADRRPATERSAHLIPVGEPAAVSLAFRRVVARARKLYTRDCHAAAQAPEPKFLADLRLHDLRHSAVTRWARTGKLSMLELAAVSGHKGLVSLKRYAHLASDQVASKLAAITDPVQPAGRACNQ